MPRLTRMTTTTRRRAWAIRRASSKRTRTSPCPESLPDDHSLIALIPFPAEARLAAGVAGLVVSADVERLFDDPQGESVAVTLVPGALDLAATASGPVFDDKPIPLEL